MLKRILFTVAVLSIFISPEQSAKIDDYEFYKQCYVKESDDWYYLNKELTDEQKERVYKIQLEINKA